MLMTDLTNRNAESERFYSIRPHDYARFNTERPVVVGRTNTGHVGTTLEWSPSGGRNWQIVSFHDSVSEAIEAFLNLPASKDRDPLHYRILHES